jgi:hypothetical protein
MKNIMKRCYYGIFINKQHYDYLPPYSGGDYWRFGIQARIELMHKEKVLPSFLIIR